MNEVVEIRFIINRPMIKEGKELYKEHCATYLQILMKFP